MTATTKTSPFIILICKLVSISAFFIGFWHAHLGLRNQLFFGSEYGSLIIAGFILAIVFISYYFLIKGQKIAIIFYLIGALCFIVYNLNYFYTFDFKEELVKEEAAFLKDTLQSYSTRGQSITSIKTDAEKDYRNLEQLKEQIYSEIKDMGGAKSIARGKIAEFNSITTRYGIKEVKPSLIGVSDFAIQADLVNKELESALKNFIEVNNEEGVTDAKAKIELATQLSALQSKYTPELEFIQTDTTKIDVSNDKRNIENNPKNIAKIAKIVSEINSVTKSVNEIYRNKNTKEPFANLEATITKIGSVGYTLPSISSHISNGTREQKVSIWKNIGLCLLFDLIGPLVIYLFIKRKETDNVTDSNFWSSNKRKFI